MKRLLLVALSLACSTASAKILTDDNLPQYDVQKECTDAHGAAEGGQAFVAHCVTSEGDARRAMFGLNVPPEMLKSCAASVEKRSPGRNNRALNICLRQQSGLAEIKKLEALVPRDSTLCADKSARGDCSAQEKKAHRFVTADPTVLTRSGTDGCIESLRTLNALSWKKIAACATNPPNES